MIFSYAHLSGALNVLVSVPSVDILTTFYDKLAVSILRFFPIWDGITFTEPRQAVKSGAVLSQLVCNMLDRYQTRCKVQYESRPVNMISEAFLLPDHKQVAAEPKPK